MSRSRGFILGAFFLVTVWLALALPGCGGEAGSGGDSRSRVTLVILLPGGDAPGTADLVLRGKVRDRLLERGVGIPAGERAGMGFMEVALLVDDPGRARRAMEVAMASEAPGRSFEVRIGGGTFPPGTR